MVGKVFQNMSFILWFSFRTSNAGDQRWLSRYLAGYLVGARVGQSRLATVESIQSGLWCPPLSLDVVHSLFVSVSLSIRVHSGMHIKI